MNIFLESVNLDEIRKATDAGIADGIDFSHVTLSADDPAIAPNDRLEEIAREFKLPICVGVSSVTSADIYREGRELAKISDHVVVEIPLIEDALVSIRRLNDEGVTVCAAFVYNGAQALLAAKAGASVVRVMLDDLEAHGQSGTDALCGHQVDSRGGGRRMRRDGRISSDGDAVLGGDPLRRRHRLRQAGGSSIADHAST